MSWWNNFEFHNRQRTKYLLKPG